MADVNIPVGRYSTSPVLSGTEGTLFVGSVYIGDFQFKDLYMEFKDGRVADYGCANFEDEKEGRALVKQIIMKNHDSLPMGEFAIGTNTTAYEVAQRYQILDKFPILIAEKTGPHFAVGDTCYSWMEDCPMFNPDGKEIVAKENEISVRRNEDPCAAYFQSAIRILQSRIQSWTALKQSMRTEPKPPLFAGGRFVFARERKSSMNRWIPLNN